MRQDIIELADKFLSKGYTGRDLISFLYERLPEHDESLARKIRYVPDINLNDIFYEYEIQFLCQNFRDVFFIFYGDSPRNPLFDGETSDLVECIGEMMNIKSDAEILIPYHGINFAIHYPSNYEFLSEDAYAEIIAKYVGHSGYTISCTPWRSKEIQITDSIEEMLTNEKTFDYIYAFPDKLLTFTPHIQKNLIQILSLLKNEGTMAIFLSDAVCSDPNWITFREHLVRNGNFSISVIKVTNIFVSNSLRGCIFLIKREPSKFITLADLSHPKFEEINTPKLKIGYIINAYKRKDPQFFINIDKNNLLDLYDLDPSHYPIDVETRIKGLIHSFLETNAHWDRNTLILSLYTYSGRFNNKYHVGHHVVNLEEVMSIENIEFLIRHLELVISICFGRDILDRYSDHRYYAYIEIISKLFENSKNKKGNLLLPDGGLEIISRLKDFYHVTSWVNNAEDDIFEHVIRGLLHIDAFIAQAPMNYRDSQCHRELFSHIVSIKEKNQQDIPEESSERIEKIIQLLEHRLECSGIMAILLPKQACYKAYWLPLREYLVKNHTTYKTTVISFNYCSLFVIEKASPWDDWRDYQRIKLVDAINRDIHDINVDAIVSAISSNHSDSVVLLPFENLDNGLNFLAAPYLSRNFASETADTYFLRDVISLIPHINVDSLDAYSQIEKIIRRDDLSSEYLNCNIRINDASSNLVRKEINYSVANGGFFTYINGQILVGKIDNLPSNSIIGIDKNVLHFNIVRSKTSLDYILKVLATDQSVAKQAKFLTKAYNSLYETTEFIDALLSVRVLIPAKTLQNFELLKDSQKGYVDKSEEVQRSFDEFRKNMHMQKHKIGQTLAALAGQISHLNYARRITEGVLNEKTVIFPSSNTTVSDILNKIQLSADRLSAEIDALDSSYGLKATDFALVDFLDEFCKTQIWSGFEIIWDSSSHRYTDDLPMMNIDDSDPTNVKITREDNQYIIRAGDAIEYISFPKEALQTILENIISNACAHGFSQKDKLYKIKFELKVEGNQVILFVSNNGDPLHKKMAVKDVFTFGQTSGISTKHSGIGGYQIRDYMQAFNGNAEFISTPDDEFTITYKLTFQCANAPVTIEL